MPTQRQSIHHVTILANAAVAAKTALDAAWKAKLRETSPERYQQIVDAFHTAVTRATPGSQPGFYQDRASGRLEAVEQAVAFLEADPWFFRSGYEKQRLIRDLKRIPLDAGHRERLRAVVLQRIDGRDRHEIRHYGRLAVALVTDEFVAGIRSRAASGDADIARRAAWILEALRSAGKC